MPNGNIAIKKCLGNRNSVIGTIKQKGPWLKGRESLHSFLINNMYKLVAVQKLSFTELQQVTCRKHNSSKAEQP